MRNIFQYALFALFILTCNSPEPQTPNQEEPAIAKEKLLAQAEPVIANPSTLILSGTEPFWNLKINQNGITFTEMGGDTLRFPYQSPVSAQGFQADYKRLYPLGKNGWALVKQDTCSDGMSDLAHPYNATVWIEPKLWSGCGRPAER